MKKITRKEVVKRVFDLAGEILEDTVTANVINGRSEPCDSGDFVEIKINGASTSIFSIAMDSPSACFQDCMRQIVKLLEGGIS